jgi:hypothetical protein
MGRLVHRAPGGAQALTAGAAVTKTRLHPIPPLGSPAGAAGTPRGAGGSATGGGALS